MKQSILILTLVLGSTVWAEKQPLSRYQSVIDRHPFGRPPAGFDPNKMASEVSKTDHSAANQPLTMEQEEIQRVINFSILNVESGGIIMVGFADKSNAKMPKHYYLAVGESQDGWLVKACDPSTETMTLEKDGVEVSFTLGSNTPTAPTAAAPTAKPMILSNKAAAPAPAQATSSYRSRRERRAAEEAAAKAEAEKKEQERKQLAEEKAAKEAAEKEAREAEREAQRQQLMAIQDELRKAREEKKRQAEMDALRAEFPNVDEAQDVNEVDI